MLPFIIMCICFFSFGYAFYGLIKDFINDEKENEKENGSGFDDR